MKASKFMQIAGLSKDIFKHVSCTADNRLLIVSKEYVHPILKAEFIGKTTIITFYQENYKLDIENRFKTAGLRVIVK
jgi:hypothetical protein